MKQMKVLFIIAVTTLLILSCKAQAQPITTATSNPTATPTAIVPISTATAKPISTPISTRTAPLPGWVTDFAEPILNAIADRPPTYQDDFSSRNSNWIVGKQGGDLGPATALPTPDPGKHNVGETGYVDGEYFTTADPNSCVGGTNSRIGEYQDFVAEFDARIVSGMDGGGGWDIHFRVNRNGLYTLGTGINPSFIGGQKCTLAECSNIFANKIIQATRSLAEWNHMIVVVRGARMAGYFNGEPFVYTEDRLFSDKFKTGTFRLSVCNLGDVPMEIRWDNLKIWDISNLP